MKTEREKNVVILQLILIEEIHNKWNLSFKDISDLFVKYNLLDYIDLSYEIYNSTDSIGALNDLKNVIIKCGGTI